MHEDLERDLRWRYPAIFALCDAESDVSAMTRGLEVGDGWYFLVDALCEALQRETDCEGAPQVVATQVKEKLGRLRFRVRNASSAQRTIISFAEDISMRICDVCGSPASKTGSKHGSECTFL